MPPFIIHYFSFCSIVLYIINFKCYTVDNKWEKQRSNNQRRESAIEIKNEEKKSVENSEFVTFRGH